MTNDVEKPLCSDVLAGDLRKGWDSTERLSNRIESYSTLKNRTSEFTEWGQLNGLAKQDRHIRRVFRKVENCGSYLIFRNYINSQRSRLIGACSCKEHLLCAFCAARRGVRNAVSYRERVDALLAENPNQQLLLITFTVQNGSELFERFSHLRASMQAFLKRRNDSLRRDTPSSFHHVTGGVFAYEVKRGSVLNGWHPHIHMLALVPKGFMLDAQAVKDEWQEITKDSKVVNIKFCEDDSAFLEVFAYALKFSEIEHSDRWHAFELLKGERLISSFGSFRGVEVAETVTDDLLETDEPWVDLLFRFSKSNGYDAGTVIDSSERSAAA